MVDVDPEVRGLLDALRAVLASAPSKARFALVAPDPRLRQLSEALTRAYSSFRLTSLDPAVGPETMHAVLSGAGPFDIMLDASHAAPGDQVALLRRFLFHVKPGGCYLVSQFRAGTRGLDPSAGVWRYVAAKIDQPATPNEADDSLLPAQRDEQRLGRALASVGVVGDLLLVKHDRNAMPKLRETRVDVVLELRPSLGRIVAARPGGPFNSRCRLTVNLHDYDHRFFGTFENPTMSLRAYRDVTCWPHQVATAQNLLLPDTYRQYYGPRLQNRFTLELGLDFAVPKNKTKRSAIPRLDGAYLYLDSEWPDHYGHTLTEQLSRLWALDRARQEFVGLKALLLLAKGRTELSAFQRDLFGAAGIPPEDLVAVRGPVRVETLVTATPMMANPDYMHPDMAAVWRRTGQSLTAGAVTSYRPNRIFCSRRPRYKRSCHNAQDVEALVAEYGYQVIYPEDHDVTEQAALFDNAERIAGFAGSAMFTTAFAAEPKQVMLLTSESYTARNEYMIASVLGHDLTVIWSDSDEKQPARGWSGSAFAAGFTVNLERDGERIRRWLDA